MNRYRKGLRKVVHQERYCINRRSRSIDEQQRFPTTPDLVVHLAVIVQEEGSLTRHLVAHRHKLT